MVTKVTLYLTSFFTTSLNAMLSVNASKLLFSLHSTLIWINMRIVWRLFTAPLATDSLFDCTLVLTFYLTKVVSPMETLRGTTFTAITFLLKSNQ